MPRMTDELAGRFNEKNANEKTALIKKRFALLSFFDKCFYSLAFGLLLISPVNAAHSHPLETKVSHVTTSSAAQLTVDLETGCNTNTSVI